MAGRFRRFAQTLISHRARRVLRVNRMNERLGLYRSKAPHMVRGHDALHRDQCEGFLGKKISSLILSLGDPSHKPLKRSFSVPSECSSEWNERA